MNRICFSKEYSLFIFILLRLLCMNKSWFDCYLFEFMGLFVKKC